VVVNHREKQQHPVSRGKCLHINS